MYFEYQWSSICEKVATSQYTSTLTKDITMSKYINGKAVHTCAEYKQVQQVVVSSSGPDNGDLVDGLAGLIGGLFGVVAAVPAMAVDSYNKTVADLEKKELADEVRNIEEEIEILEAKENKTLELNAALKKVSNAVGVNLFLDEDYKDLTSAFINSVVARRAELNNNKDK